jgi:hypothetical protein
MSAQVEIGILHRHAFAHPRAAADSRGVAQIRDGHFDDFVHLAGCSDERGTLVRHAHHRMQREPAHEDVHGRQLAEHPNGGRIDANFLGRFAQCGLRERFPFIGSAAREADLPGVPRQAARAHGQRDRDVVVERIQQHEHRGAASVGRHVSRSPSRPGRCGGEPELRVEPGQRSLQPFAQYTLDCREGHEPSILTSAVGIDRVNLRMVRPRRSATIRAGPPGSAATIGP